MDFKNSPEQDFPQEEIIKKPEIENIPLYPSHDEVFSKSPEIFEPGSFEYDQLLKSYRLRINNPEAILGQGNKAIVFDTIKDGKKFCTKIQWQRLDVEIASKNYDQLPEDYKSLRNFQEYFMEIRRKKDARERELGNDYAQQNLPYDEAIVMLQAREILKSKGNERFIPEMEDFNILSREHEGDKINGEPFYLSEEAHMTRMEKINGASIEDLIINHEFYNEFIKTLDTDKITLQLGVVLKQLHSQQFVHGDISIRNIMIDTESGEPRLIDFGTSGFNKMGISPERDLQHLEECMRHLKSLIKDPEAKRNMLNL